MDYHKFSYSEFLYVYLCAYSKGIPELKIAAVKLIAYFFRLKEDAVSEILQKPGCWDVCCFDNVSNDIYDKLMSLMEANKTDNKTIKPTKKAGD